MQCQYEHGCVRMAADNSRNFCTQHLEIHMDSIVKAATPSGAEEYHLMKALDYADEYGWDD